MATVAVQQYALRAFFVLPAVQGHMEAIRKLDGTVRAVHDGAHSVHVNQEIKQKPSCRSGTGGSSLARSTDAQAERDPLH